MRWLCRSRSIKREYVILVGELTRTFSLLQRSQFKTT